ncbi:prepilin-type N-terminal cleavage/methylation domain-containing protein [Keratinibaculum paraultunense]|uniref:Prepilin-type N-terminal cleavage/methylation domain-containing protein n=1 Tax=Keratinibaculum paraultunense TaxID=1278232 RepID=A0A4R3L166_9FIRM|nr:prepilin-type N-terminal cleavage/methylation domain-containing protein [Keratinibaculum paraultunense]QQY80597.1 prepilin-type N-terminal cleavage/methylation domain-containing protein [Keratinibaculum paraultunense]TCS91327.1 prepilin-type N-terminal cleavage/methylation domain-containing protein [Keratinibaculum paraultunense]
MNIKGFTLVELILVISILGVILLIPMLKGNIALNYKEKFELKTFKKDIEYARNKAITDVCCYSVILNFNKNCYIIKKHDKIEVTLKKYEFESGIRLIGSKNLGTQISFGYLGTPIKAGTIYLEDKNGNKIEIAITPATGKVNIYFK